MRSENGNAGDAQTSASRPLGLCLAILVALAASASLSAATARTHIASNIFPCGVVHGPAWAVSSRERGNDWAIFGDRTNTVCAAKSEWATRLGGPLMDVRAPVGVAVSRKTFDHTAYGCILARTILVAICLTGDGGPSSTGVIAIANPSENPYASIVLGGDIVGDAASPSVVRPSAAGASDFSFPEDSLDARQVGDPVCAVLPRTTWQIRGFGPESVIDHGTGWNILAPEGTCGLAGLTDVAQRAVRKANEIDQSAPTDGALFELGDWQCLASRRHRRVDGHVLILGVPFAGCVRRTYPFGDGSGVLSTFVVVPTARGARDSPPPADLLYALRSRGIAALVHYSRTGEGTTWGTQPVWNCGTQLITGLPGAAPIRWSMATSGRYPCDLALTEYAPSLAAQALTTGLTAREVGSPPPNWTCSTRPEGRVAVCSFDPSVDRRIRAAFGHSSGPDQYGPFRVAIVAGNDSPITRQDLANALRTGRA